MDPLTIATAASAGAQVLGSILTADATRDAQNSANRTNIRLAEQASTDRFNAYLVSRGINPGLIGLPGTADALEPHMDGLRAEYDRVKATGMDRRSFNQWLQDFLRDNPTSEPARALASESVNTTLPLWAELGGAPAEEALFNKILGLSPALSDPTSPSVFASRQNVERYLAANPQDAADIAAMLAENGDPRSPVEWTIAHVTDTERGAGEFSGLLRDFATQENAAAQERAQVPTNISDLQTQAETFAGGLFDGGLLERDITALEPVEEARLRMAEIERARVAEQRTRSNDILGVEMAGLEDLLGTRLAGAEEIFGAERDSAGRLLGARNMAAEGLFGARNLTAEDLFAAEQGAARGLFGARGGAAERLFGARESGARGMYDADLTSAQIFDEANQLAVQDAIARQDAQRARQGFAGGGSGDDLMRARILAEGFTQSASQRGAAGQTLAQRLAAAGEGRAGDLGFADVELAELLGGADVGRAGRLGDSRIGRATDLGFADVENAGLLGRAGVERATRTSTSREADSAARLSAQSDNARRLALFLDSDADDAMAGAELQNATDRYNANMRDLERSLSNLGTPGRLFSSRVSTDNLAAGVPFQDIDQVLARLGSFRLNETAPPAPVVPNINPVISGGDIAGGALSTLGKMGMDYFTTERLIRQMNRTGTGAPVGTDGTLGGGG